MIRENIMAGAVMTILFFGFPVLVAQAAEHGVSGTSVMNDQEIREQLYRMGYYKENPADYFNFLTSTAVTRFQKDYDLPATGIIGSATKVKLQEVEMMARIVHGEARGESLLGQIGVAAVILNRIGSSDFPPSTEEVIFQKNAFTAVIDDQYLLTPNETAYRAVKYALDGVDPTEGAVFYYNPAGVTDNWIFSRTVLTQIGRHFFAE